MLFRSSAHPGKAVRLAYCMNLHAGETLGELCDGIRRITLPLRERLAPKSEFGVGMYLPAKLARELANDALQLAKLKRFLDDNALDPFTYNAFPYGGFATDGLKQRVFEPMWSDPARELFTCDVANVAAQIAGSAHEQRHLSISTHTGGHSSRWHGLAPAEIERLSSSCSAARARVGAHLTQLRERTGWFAVLALEAEPRANCNDTRELAVMLAKPAATSPYAGACLDTCHAAVEFEDPLEAWRRTAVDIPTSGGARIGKVQFSSALAVRDARDNSAAITQLFALHEPRYLHQVTARRGAQLERVGDIEVASAAWTRQEIDWHEFDELRCHFHVPVDRRELDGGLDTTSDYAGEVLAIALARPHEWGGSELHVEIETYTWDVLPRAARGAGELVDGLEREYRHVIGVLESAGWKHVSS